ncbi:MAG: glycosyltransferase [Actinobacteria bacterium]|nr:glycosyltransferase [Actinomycetota bacterium]
MLVHQFPVRSETFIVDHVAGLLDRGHEVVVLPLTPRPTAEWNVPSAVAAIVNSTAPKPESMPAAGFSRAAKSLALGVNAVMRHHSRPLRVARDDSITTPRGFGRRLLLAERAASGGPFDVVHAQFGTTASAAAAIRRHGVSTAPIVCSVHGQDVNIDIGKRGARLASLASELAVVTTGTEFMREVVAGVGVPAGRIRIWPQGVNVDRPPVSPRRARGFHVLSVGRLVEFKGIDDSLRVIAAARPQIEGIRYTVIGDGPLRSYLIELARGLAIDDITTFAGARDHAEVLAAHADVDVFLQMGKVGSDGSCEGQGVGPAEASASGLACVVTASGGLPEVVRADETGLVYQTGDIAAAADGLVRLSKDPALRRRLGDAGRAFVSANYSMSASIDTIEQIYADAMEQWNEP